MDPQVMALLLTVLVSGVIGLAAAGVIWLVENHFGWDTVMPLVITILGGMAIGLGAFGMLGHWLYHKILPCFM